MPVPGSKRARRASPESITTRTPSMVSDVSAMAVASTTFRPAPAGATAARCAASGIVPCSRCSATSGGSRPASAAATRPISAAPGRNISTEPGSAASAPSAVSASRRSRAPGRSGAARPSRQRVSTGWARPSEVTTVAPPISAATGAASSVADMTRIERSPRSAPAMSSASARPRSASRLRSWNSSKMRCETPSSPGSRCSRRVSRPSVTTSIRVASETRASPRIR